MSKKGKTIVDAIEVETPEVEAEVAAPVVAEPEPTPMVTGVVVNCTRLNIRKAPNKTAEVAVEVAVNTELMIDAEKSTEEWYRVWTASGIEGFCVKDFVAIKQ